MNATFRNLQDVFVIPSSPGHVLIYAPLLGIAKLCREEVVSPYLQSAHTREDLIEIPSLRSFVSEGKVRVSSLLNDPSEAFQIDILLNYTCNFHCVYCYSAQGRSSKQIDFLVVKSLIDYLFNSGKPQSRIYQINFSGGGEPLVSYPLIRKTVEYIEQSNQDRRYNYSVGLVTNGSLLTPEMVSFFASHSVNVAVSFEVLKDLQDLERGSYEKVAEHIDLLLDARLPFGIRTTFTPNSVGRMCDIVEELHHRFPRVKTIVFDTVLSPALLGTPLLLKQYYDDFLKNYYQAKERAAGYGITIQSVAAEMLPLMRERTCTGKIVLTPEGTISSCARISSPKEALYPEYIYGHYENGAIVFDAERYREILSRNNIFAPRCLDCYGRWNCGGGCKLFTDLFPEAFLDVHCAFVREALKLELEHLLQV